MNINLTDILCAVTLIPLLAGMTAMYGGIAAMIIESLKDGLDYLSDKFFDQLK